MAVLAIVGAADADLLAYYDFTGAEGLPTTQNEGTVGTVADGVLMNGATIVDIDPDERAPLAKQSVGRGFTIEIGRVQK